MAHYQPPSHLPNPNDPRNWPDPRIVEMKKEGLHTFGQSVTGSSSALFHQDPRLTEMEQNRQRTLLQGTKYPISPSQFGEDYSINTINKFYPGKARVVRKTLEHNYGSINEIDKSICKKCFENLEKPKFKKGAYVDPTIWFSIPLKINVMKYVLDDIYVNPDDIKEFEKIPKGKYKNIKYYILDEKIKTMIKTAINVYASAKITFSYNKNEDLYFLDPSQVENPISPRSITVKEIGKKEFEGNKGIKITIGEIGKEYAGQSLPGNRYSVVMKNINYKTINNPGVHNSGVEMGHTLAHEIAHLLLEGQTYFSLDSRGEPICYDEGQHVDPKYPFGKAVRQH